ncbi:hypothetical protein [Kordia jejudonensis]|uniref:hypothetical protein n=1 Tax=Kordia jejudonensis TaxID=1348245 RepID=UPI0006298FCC|nr:hypothetical protein [Kordia jejudonensis]
MKKKNLKSLKLNKRSISNLEKRNAVGGQAESISFVPCWSIISCPTVGCTQEACDISIPMTDCISLPVIFHPCRADIQEV